MKVSPTYFNQTPIIVYFIAKGEAAYVLPRFDNKAFMELKTGEHFGHVDLAEDTDFISTSSIEYKVNAFNRYHHVRRFTVQAFGSLELLTLSINEVIKMKFEFPKMFELLFMEVDKHLNRQLLLKVEMARQHEIELIAKSGGTA